MSRLLTVEAIAQIIHDEDCFGCPFQSMPHTVSKCRDLLSRQKDFDTAYKIIEAMEAESEAAA